MKYIKNKFFSAHLFVRNNMRFIVCQRYAQSKTIAKPNKLKVLVSEKTIECKQNRQ
jgi:hypothetical protein